MHMTDQRRYFRKFRIWQAPYAVHRIAGAQIRAAAEQYLRGRLIDVGCGAKNKRLLIGDLVEAYVGVDHADSMHDLSDVDMIGSAYAIPVDDGSFDSLLCTSVLEHLEEPDRAIGEAHRILKPGGHALYTVPLFWHLHEQPRDFFRYTEYGLRHLFESAGFAVIEIRALSGFWVTFGSELSYYLNSVRQKNRVAQFLFKPLSLACALVVNITCPLLDKTPLRDELYTWAYLVVARKPDVGK